MRRYVHSAYIVKISSNLCGADKFALGSISQNLIMCEYTPRRFNSFKDIQDYRDKY